MLTLFKNARILTMKSSDVFSITVIDGERALIGGRGGALYTGSFDTSLEALKRHLPEFVVKGETY